MRSSFFTSLFCLYTSSALAFTTSIMLRIPPSHVLPNPRSLSPSTHATLTSLDVDAFAYLTPSDTFLFQNISDGSYLLDVHSTTHAFMPLRVEVTPVVSGPEDGSKEVSPVKVKVSAWETYRGNDWGNKGEAAARENGIVEVRALATKTYYMERSSFNVLSILKNPMILLGLVSMGIFVGMPYLVDNMDPDMKKEWEESQKSNPMNSLMGGGQSGPGNFDMAAFLAGSSQKENRNGGVMSSGGSKKEKASRM